jgi:glycogen(starch) synthase
MKVLFVTREDPGNIVGGLGTFVRDFVPVLREKAEVKLLLIRLNRPEDQEEPPPSDLVDVFINVNRTYPTQDRDVIKAEEAMEILSQVYPLLEEWKPDVIHLNDRHPWMPFRHFPNTVFSLHLSMADLVGMLGMDEKGFHELKLDKDACAKAGALIVYSQFTRKTVWNQLCDFAGPIVLPLGFNTGKYYSDKPSDKIIISFFGRLVQGQKGYFEFLQAIDMVDPELIEKYSVEFQVYGKGELPDWLPTRRVTRSGFLDGYDLKRAFAQSHVVVMPSKYEPFGLVGLEALASGCVLLCTEGQGMDEFIIPNKNYVPILSDPFDIRDKLEMVLKSPGKYFGREFAIQESVKHWTWERCVNEHLKVYHQVMVGRASQLKWAHGQTAMRMAKAWEKTVTKRKSKLQNIYSLVQPKLIDGKILVLGAVEEELKSYAAANREIIPHTFSSPPKNWVSFHTEYILVPPETVDQIVFIYGIEFVPHIDYSLAELHRIVKDSVILGVSFEDPGFGIMTRYTSWDKIQLIYSRLYQFELLEAQRVEFLDENDGRKKEMGLFHLKKLNKDEIAQKVNYLQSLPKDEGQ